MTKKAIASAPPEARLAVKMRTVESLTPYAKNARTHSAEQIARIAASIENFGWTNPILIDSESGIVAGHGRLAAAKKLGMTEVPVIELAGLSDEQRRAYIIFDNQVALEAGWDEALRSSEISDLKSQDFDLALIGDFEAPPPGRERSGTRKTTFRTATISYNIVFDNPGQQEVWFAFVKRLQALYPNAETIAERISAFLTENADV
jgi:hypothetical protein